MSEIKFPTSQEEMDAIRKSLVIELTDDALDGVAGGNDIMKEKFDPPRVAVCPWCGQTITMKFAQDASKHMTKCPGNPYK